MEKVKKCIFFSVSNYSKSYKLYNPITKKIFISHYINFYEKKTWIWSCNIVGQKIPIDFNGGNEEEMQQAHQQQVPTVPTLKDP